MPQAHIDHASTARAAVARARRVDVGARRSRPRRAGEELARGEPCCVARTSTPPAMRCQFVPRRDEERPVRRCAGAPSSRSSRRATIAAPVGAPVAVALGPPTSCSVTIMASRRRLRKNAERAVVEPRETRSGPGQRTEGHGRRRARPAHARCRARSRRPHYRAPAASVTMAAIRVPSRETCHRETRVAPGQASATRECRPADRNARDRRGLRRAERSRCRRRGRSLGSIRGRVDRRQGVRLRAGTRATPPSMQPHRGDIAIRARPAIAPERRVPDRGGRGRGSGSSSSPDEESEALLGLDDADRSTRVERRAGTASAASGVEPTQELDARHAALAEARLRAAVCMRSRSWSSPPAAPRRSAAPGRPPHRVGQSERADRRPRERRHDGRRRATGLGQAVHDRLGDAGSRRSRVGNQRTSGHEKLPNSGSKNISE